MQSHTYYSSLTEVCCNLKESMRDICRIDQGSSQDRLETFYRLGFEIRHVSASKLGPSGDGALGGRRGGGGGGVGSFCLLQLAPRAQNLLSEC